MTTPIFIRPASYPHWCRLLTIGAAHHVTACLGMIDAADPLLLTAAMPGKEILCSACWRDMEVRRAQSVTVDLRPYVRELGVRVGVEIDELRIEEESA